MTPVRLEPAALRSRVKNSTTEPLRSLKKFGYFSNGSTKTCFADTQINHLGDTVFAYLCSLLISFANGLVPDQDRQNVGPDLDPNYLKL